MTRICAVVFAAGFSARLGQNKLLIRINEKTLLERSIEPFIDPSIDKVFVVVGFERERIEAVLKGQKVDIIYNPNYREGMSASLKASLPFVSHYDAIFFQLGDRPFTDKAIIKRMLCAFYNQSAHIVVPIYKGKKGHPVLIRLGNYIREIEDIEGDKGLREIIDKYHRNVVFIEGNEGIILGVDTQEDLNNLAVRGYEIKKD